MGRGEGERGSSLSLFFLSFLLPPSTPCRAASGAAGVKELWALRLWRPLAGLHGHCRNKASRIRPLKDLHCDAPSPDWLSFGKTRARRPGHRRSSGGAPFSQISASARGQTLFKGPGGPDYCPVPFRHQSPFCPQPEPLLSGRHAASVCCTPPRIS